eukprot:1072605-Heterocapsa_arctica.AAC.1
MNAAMDKNDDAVFLHLRIACKSCGAFIGCLHLRIRRVEDILGPARKPLEVYASHVGFLDIWKVTSMFRFLFVVIAWLLLVTCRVALS